MTKYFAVCTTCGYVGRAFESKVDADADGDEHEIAVGDNRQHHYTRVLVSGRPTTDPKQLKFWRELHDGYTRTGTGYEVICRQFKDALDEIDRLNAVLHCTEES